MRTLIQGGDIVALDGHRHRLLKDGVVVFEGSTIIHVGPSYQDKVDRRIDARGMLITPGFINTHVHVGVEVMTALLDVGRPVTRGWLSPSRRYVSSPPKASLTEEEQRIHGEFGLVQLLKSGCTTILDAAGSGTLWWLGNPPGDVEIFADTVGRLGARAYISPMYRSHRVYADESGKTGYHLTDRQGFDGLAQAVRFIERHHGRYNGRVQGMLYPHAVDNCTPDLLRETKKAAKALGVGIQIHAAQGVGEVEVVRAQHGLTPIELLADIEFLGPEVLLGHCVFVRGHSSIGGDPGADLRLIADARASVAHSPRPFARQGVALESFQRYLDAGITMAIGTDFWPVDIISEMRLASLLCKVVDRDPRSAGAADVFTAATLGAARAIGRQDLGRLSPGARADIVLIDIANSQRIGPVADPVKGVLAAGTSDDVRMVIADGRTVVDNGRVVGVDEERLRHQAEGVAARLRAALAARDWAGRTEAEIFPLAFPTLPATGV